MNLKSGSGDLLMSGKQSTGVSPGHHIVFLTLSGYLSRSQLQGEPLRQQFLKLCKTVSEAPTAASE